MIWPWFLVLVLLSKSSFCLSELWQVEKNRKSVSIAEVSTTKISHSLFLQNIWQTLMFTEKTFSNESRKRWQLLFEVYLFTFILFLHLSIYNVIIMNIQWSKQSPYTSNCLWNLHFFKCTFVVFWKLSKKLIYF